MPYVLPSVSPPPRGLRISDYVDSARELGCQVAAVRAVADVESAGDGFLLDGRPKILFEAHKFSEYTGHRFDSIHPNISSLNWNRKLYRGGVGEYARLQQALAVNPSAALKAASWGKFQILGANFAMCGFKSVEDFVAAHYHSENEQLDAFVSFVKTRKLDGHLRALNWGPFALGYNGRRYREQKYDEKMAAAYARYAKAGGLT